MKINTAILSILMATFATLLLQGCSSAERRDLTTTGNAKITQVQDKFFAEPSGEGELFRIFSSSENYEIRQYGGEDKIVITSDPQGEQAFTGEVAAFDKIEFFSDAVFRVEIYEDTGNISRIRPVKPARISELNKLIADDITRLKFEFPDGQIAPLVFDIRYGIYLQKKVSDKEIRNVLEKNVR